MTPPVHPFRIIPCNEWGARPPRHPIFVGGPIDKAIFHHTAGHAPDLDHKPSENYAEAEAYARAVQTFHMNDRGWADTGQNALVARTGHIFEGRHRSLELLESGRMPISAHCFGENGSSAGHRGFGVEIEHLGSEEMTPAQYAAAVWLFAVVLRKPSPNLKTGRIYGHKDFNSTECPGPLYQDLPEFRQDVKRELAGHGGGGAPAGWQTPRWFVPWAKWWLEGQDEEKRPAGVPRKIPRRAFLELDKIGGLYLAQSGQAPEIVKIF